jgi:DNA-binding response OmpR family regulator
MAKILLIDDERDLLAMLAEVLAHDGHWVTALASGLSVLKSADATAVARTFDLIITDVMLPDINGLEIIRALKAANPSVLTIAMSGGMPDAGSESWQGVAKNVGVTATLAKPFSMFELRQTVAQTLNTTGPDPNTALADPVL